eukprot:GDKH01005485.1.p2 GENE.GDKH01005485.1~~GDKH01005485.1.p2  ORF type:complete len:107 (+),score=11.50 GDKH01005485.1:122-442(+)
MSLLLRGLARRGLASPFAAQASRAPVLTQSRMISRSIPRHSMLEKHYMFAEWVVEIGNPIFIYALKAGWVISLICSFIPLLHSNYYFSGRFFPKPESSNQLCEESW